MRDHFERLLCGAKGYGVSIDERQLEQFALYYEILVEKNRVMNLTAITEMDEVIEKHFLDSLALAQVIKLDGAMSVMDMGTGAGFPGIPLKIAFPELSVTLADSLNKRVQFLCEVIQALGLKKIEAVHGRAEELARENMYRETYDLTVSRAVANLSTLAEYCLPFVKVGGCFVSYKSGECDEEVASAALAIQTLGGQLSEVKKFQLGEAGRAFVIIDKKNPTAKKYPRKAGTPSRDPLK